MNAFGGRIEAMGVVLREGSGRQTKEVAVRLLVMLVVMGGVLVSNAQEAGIVSGVRRDRLPEPVLSGYTGQGTLGVRAGVGWGRLAWDIGPADGSANVAIPEATCFYMFSDNADVHLSVAGCSGDDQDNVLGGTEATAVGVSVGSRYLIRQAGFQQCVPYVGGDISYFVLDADLDNTLDAAQAPVPVGSVDVDNWIGIGIEAGMALLLADEFYLNLDVSYRTPLGDADAEIDGSSADFSMNIIAVSLGLTLAF